MMSLVRLVSVAVFRRWDPERQFLIYTAYLDESGTHDGSATLVFGGFLADARSWEWFEKRFNKLRLKYGFRIFHAKDLKAKRGDFEGWSDEKCLNLVVDIIRLVNERLSAGAFISLSVDDYKKYQTAPKRTGMRLDTAYGLCFRACVAHFLQATADELGRIGNLAKLNVIAEEGHANAGDAVRIFAEMRKSIKVHNAIDPLGTSTFAEKAKMPLMAADFLSFTMFMRDKQRLQGAPELPPLGTSGSGKFRLTELRLDSDVILTLSHHLDHLRRENIVGKVLTKRYPLTPE